jgi:RNA polymerase sigma-70 factor (ECF subfamily)
MNSAQRSKSQVTSPSSEGDEPIIDQFTARLIRRKARQLVGRAGFSRSDREDIEQELRLKLVKHFSSYDSGQGHRHAFVTAVVERHAANLLRDKQAEKRDHRRVRSLNVVIADDEDEGPVELGDTISRRELDARLGRSTGDQHHLAELVLDTAEVIAGLTPELRKLAERLKTDSVSRVARDLRVPRTTLNGRIRELRQRFERAGLRDYL